MVGEWTYYGHLVHSVDIETRDTNVTCGLYVNSGCSISSRKCENLSPEINPMAAFALYSICLHRRRLRKTYSISDQNLESVGLEACNEFNNQKEIVKKFIYLFIFLKIYYFSFFNVRELQCHYFCSCNILFGKTCD